MLSLKLKSAWWFAYRQKVLNRSNGSQLCGCFYCKEYCRTAALMQEIEILESLLWEQGEANTLIIILF
jgi:hypothetical protein